MKYLNDSGLRKYNEKLSNKFSGYEDCGEVIWSNPNPTESFSAQTVKLKKSLSNFTEYAILFKYWRGDKQLINTGRIPIHYGTKLNSGYDNNSSRNVNEQSQPTDNTMIFDNAQNQTSFSGNTYEDNNRCVPIYIIGYKNGVSLT